MIQWTLQIVGGDMTAGALQLVDPDGSVIASADMTDDLAALLAHVDVGDQITFVGDVAD